MKTFLIFGWAAIAWPALGADTLKAKPAVRYSVSIQAGSLLGRQQATSAVGVTNWFTWHRLTRAHAGLGVSWENYEGWQTVPFSVQARYDLGKNKRYPWFIYGGYGQSWARLVPDYRPFNFAADHGGRVYYFGLGKSVRYEKVELSWQVGHHAQRVAWEEAYRFQNWRTPRTADVFTNRTHVEMMLRRVAVTMSVRWR